MDNQEHIDNLEGQSAHAINHESDSGDEFYDHTGTGSNITMTRGGPGSQRSPTPFSPEPSGEPSAKMLTDTSVEIIGETSPQNEKRSATESELAAGARPKYNTTNSGLSTWTNIQDVEGAKKSEGEPTMDFSTGSSTRLPGVTVDESDPTLQGFLNMPDNEFRAKVLGIITHIQVTQDAHYNTLRAIHADHKRISDRFDAFLDSVNEDSIKLNNVSKHTDKVIKQLNDLEGEFLKVQKIQRSRNWKEMMDCLEHNKIELGKVSDDIRDALIDINTLRIDHANVSDRLSVVETSTGNMINKSALQTSVSNLESFVEGKLMSTKNQIRDLSIKVDNLNIKKSPPHRNADQYGSGNADYDTFTANQLGMSTLGAGPNYVTPHSSYPDRSSKSYRKGRMSQNDHVGNFGMRSHDFSAQERGSMRQNFDDRANTGFSGLGDGRGLPSGNHSQQAPRTDMHNVPHDIGKDLPKLEKFSGEGKDGWDNFIEQFETYALLKGWRHDASILRMYLCGKALEHYNRQSRDVKADYERSKQALKKRFESSVPREAMKASFQSLRQKTDEGIRDFADRVRKTARFAFSDLQNAEEYVEKEMVKAFLKGLIGQDLGLYGFSKNYLSYEDCVDDILVYRENKIAVLASKHVRLFDARELEQEDVDVFRTQNAPASPTPKGPTTNLSPDLVSSLTKAMTQMSESLKEIKKPVFTQTQLNESLRSTLQQLLPKESPKKEVDKPVLTQAQLTETIRTSLQQLLPKERSEHPSRDQTRSPNRSRSNSREKSNNCYECNEAGHFARECPQKALKANGKV